MTGKVNQWPNDSSRIGGREQPANGAVLPLAQALTDQLNGNIESALARLNSLDTEDGNLADIVAARGHLLLEAGRFEEAQRQFASLISTDSSLEAAHFHSGFC